MGFEEYLAEAMAMARPQNYRRDGTPYPLGREGTLEWARDYEDVAKRQVKVSRTWYAERLSTVWLGLDHGFGVGPPLIFETMAFEHWPRWRPPLRLNAELEMPGSFSFDDLVQERWSSEREALEGHAAILREMRWPPFLRRLVLGRWKGIARWQ